MRLAAHALAVVWCLLGVLAAIIADSTDNTSGVLLLASMLVWSVAVRHVWQRRRSVVGIAATAPQNINDVPANALPGVRVSAARPTFEMEGTRPADQASGEEHSGNGEVIMGSVPLFHSIPLLH